MILQNINLMAIIVFDNVYIDNILGQAKLIFPLA